MSPLPGTRVVPEGWAQHHERALAGTRTVPAEFWRDGGKGPAPFPRPADWSDDGAKISQCMVRVEAAAGSGSTLAGMQPTTESSYTVAVGLADLPSGLRFGEGGDTVRVMGKRLRIMRDETSSLEGERVLVCTENLRQVPRG